MNTKGLTKKYTVLHKLEDTDIGWEIETFEKQSEVETFLTDNKPYAYRIFYGWEFFAKTEVKLTRFSGGSDE